MSANGAGGPAPNIFGIEKYDGYSQFFGGAAPLFPLSQGVGWAILIGFAVAFFFIASFLLWCDTKFAGAKYNTEQFNTAGRTIGAGLIAVDVVSHWVWTSNIVGAGTYAWFYGASSPMWYGTGTGTMTVWLFCVVAIELKHRAPKAHTFLEVIKVRWGRQCHIIFMFFAFAVNCLVCLQIMQNAVVTINAVTGVNIYASSFVLPLGVAAYAIIGGLKATFTTSYLHTIFIYIVALIFLFVVYTRTDRGLGSIDLIWERLVEIGKVYPVGGNKDGSYLTVYSLGAFEINLINVLSTFSVMFVDQSYWQSAIAASPDGAVKGYALGSYLYLGIVFSLGIGLPLGGLALDLPISLNEVYSNLVMPACGWALMGKAGPLLIVCLLFMAVTSCGAGEMLAVSSLFTFDVWREYVRPKASGAELVLVSRFVVFFWACFMGGLLAILNAASVNVYWLAIWPGVVTSGAVGPVVYAIAWDRCTGFAAGWCGAIFGMIGGIVTWLVWPAIIYGTVTINTTERNGGVLVASGISLAIGIIVPPIVTWLTTKSSGPRFDWNELDSITFTDDDSTGVEDKHRAFIAKWRKPIWYSAAISFVCVEILWPLLTLPAGGVWSKAYFRFMIVLGFLICFTSGGIAILLPLWEGRLEAFDLFNWLLRRDKKPYGPTRRAVPDGISPPDGPYTDGTGDSEKAIALADPVALKDDSAHNGQLASKP